MSYADKIFKDIYAKDVDRQVNPAVSTSDDSEQTIKTEIDEYVFTDEIIDGLYDVLKALKEANMNHIGMWISGYFGSGKSHFLKYLNYCLLHKEGAVERLLDKVKDIDPMTSSSKVVYSEVLDIVNWLEKSTIKVVMFNIGQVDNVNTTISNSFIEAIWKQFNSSRGYNSYNLQLARYFEKVLDEKGVFDQFKQNLMEEGYNWEIDGQDLAETELNYILGKGKELVPSLSVESISQRIINKDDDISVASLGLELKKFLDDKPQDYRLIFLLDEVSQFISARKDLLLQLQEIVTRLQEDCEGRVWVACTAQQDLSQVLDDCKISETQEEIGKITGRFEVKVQLKGSETDYITCERLLKKNTTGLNCLAELYNEKKDIINNLFELPTGYNTYRQVSQEKELDVFQNYYPFVPYQFKLIMEVFDAFTAKQFVQQEVKGNERSIIKVTDATVKMTKECNLGTLIPFDQFFNPMFQNNLTAMGQRAIKRANDIIDSYTNPQFGRRVVNILFMLCNLKESTQRLFPATVDYITSLLIDDVDCQKRTLKESVIQVLEFLIDKSVIHEVKDDKQTSSSYLFYSDVEMEMAEAIRNEKLTRDFMADQVKDCLTSNLLSFTPRVKYCTRDFLVSVAIMGRTVSGTGNVDVKVRFAFDDSEDTAAEYARNQGDRNTLTFFMANLYHQDKTFVKEFHRYCQVAQYLANNHVGNNPQATQTQQHFRDENKEIKSRIDKKIREMFNKCDVICGTEVVDNMGSETDKQRYEALLQRQLKTMYTQATYVFNTDYATDNIELQKRVRRNLEVYSGIIPNAENIVLNYINKQGRPLSLREIQEQFAKTPYGWNDVCTADVVNELARRHIFDIQYNNIDIDQATLASKITQKQECGNLIVKAARTIDKSKINQLRAVWKSIFNSEFPNCDDYVAVKTAREELSQHSNAELRSQVKNYPVCDILDKVTSIVEAWKAERDENNFLEKFIGDQDEAIAAFDARKDLQVEWNDKKVKYIEFYNFARDNEDNWFYLPDDNNTQTAIAKIKEILTDATPWPNLRTYKQAYDELNKQLKAKKDELRKEIVAVYTEMFDFLEKYAADNKVPRSAFDSTDAFICRMTQSEKLMQLDNNYKSVQNHKDNLLNIIQRAIKPEPNVSTSTTQPANAAEAPGIYTTTAVVPTKKTVRFHLKTDAVIHNEADVDAYLQKLRQEIMTHLNNNDEVIIL